jgi:chromosome segregation ATPase
LDDLDWAIKVVDRAYEESNRAAMIDPRRQSKKRTQLVTTKAQLLRARHMGDQFWLMMGQWSEESQAAYREARDLVESVKLFMDSAGDEAGMPEADYRGAAHGDLSLTGDAAKLGEKIKLIREAFNGRLAWQNELRALRGEIETLTASASNDKNLNLTREKFWRPTMLSLNDRLTALEKANRELAQRALAAKSQVSRALTALENTEAILLGQSGSDLKKHSEILSIKVETHLRNAVSLCLELRDFWKILPSLVGKPRRLDKTVISIAAYYGQTLSALEELRGNLARFTGRLSNTREVRAKAQRALNAPDRGREFDALIESSKNNLATLGHLILYKSSSEYHQGLAQTIRSDLEGARQRENSLNLILENKNEEIMALQARLAALPQSARPDDRTLERLSAVLNERNRLEDHLAQARNRLTSMGVFKAQILKSIEKAKLALEKAVSERSDFERGNRQLVSEMGSLKNSYATLAHSHNLGLQKIAQLEKEYQLLSRTHQIQSHEANAYLEERAKNQHELNNLRSQISEVKDNYEKLKTLKADQETAMESLKVREATLLAEISTKTDEFKEVGLSRERLGKLVSSLRTQLDRLIVAHGALKASWANRGQLLAQSEEEKDSLRLKLDRQKRNLITLVTKRQKLLSDMGEQRLRLDEFEREKENLLAQIERAKESGLESEALNEELKKLHQEINENLKPLIQVLSMALWRGQVQLKAVQEAADKKLKERDRDALAREATIRVAGAAKEIDYLELLSTRNKELEHLKAERNSMSEELEALRKGAASTQNEESARNSWLCQQLSLALSAASIRQERLTRSLRDFKLNFDKQKEESEAIKTELNDIIKNQARALTDHEAWLGELVPLVKFFLDSGKIFWGGLGKEDSREAVLFFMARENAELAEELSQIKGERQALFAERQNYLRLNDSVRKRLSELQPLVEFLVVNFVQTTASLAQLTLERQELQNRVALLSGRGADRTLGPNGPMAAAGFIGTDQSFAELITPGGDYLPMSPEMGKARLEIQRLTRENSKLSQSVTQVERALDQANLNVASLEKNLNQLQLALNQTQKDLAFTKEESDLHFRDKADLKAQLEDERTKLTVARAEAGRLALELAQKQTEAAQASQELTQLQADLSEAQKAPQGSDGHFEASLALVTYVNSKAEDAINNLQAKLEKQAWDLESAFEELKKRDEAIKTLRQNQDRLSLMWWTIFSLAGDGQGSLAADELPPPPSGEGDQGEGAQGEIAPAHEESLELLGLDSSLANLNELDFSALEEAKTALPEKPEAGPEAGPEATGPEAGAEAGPGAQPEGAQPEGGQPEGGEKKDEKLAGSFLAELRKAARRALFTLFLAGVAFSPARSARGDGPLLLGTPETPMVSELIGDDLNYPKTPGLICLSSNYLGRNMDLGVVSEADLAQGPTKVEEKAREMIAAQARRWGFGQETYLRLVRLAYDRQAKVDLSDLEGDQGPLKLLKPHLPIFTKALEETGLVSALAPPILAAVLDFTPIEGAFWDRFFTRSRLTLKDNPEAVRALAWHITARSRRLNRVRPIGFNPVGWPSAPKRPRPAQNQPQNPQANPQAKPGAPAGAPAGQGPNEGLTPGVIFFQYAGQMAPFYSLERMEFEKAVSFLDSFISKIWGRDFSRAKKRGVITRPLPKSPEPKRLASDLLQIAHLNRLPRTVFVSMVHADFETLGLWPTTLELYGWGQRLTDLFYDQSVVWSQTQTRLLDFDNVYDHLSNLTKSNQLEICHIKLHNHLLSYLTPRVSVFGDAPVFAQSLAPKRS